VPVKPALFLLLLLASASIAEARLWVVGQNLPGAADANPGTPEQPLLTCNAAAQQAQPGDTVLVHAGIYRERIMPARGGTSDQPIVYQAAPGEAVIVRGSDAWTDWQPVAGQPGVFTAQIEDHLPAGAPNPFLIKVNVSGNDPDIAARPADPAAPLPKTLGQLFFNSRPVIETDSESLVPLQENTWVATADGKRLLAHFPGNPADLASDLIEVSVRDRIFAPRLRGLNDIEVRGFVFEHCANQGGFPQTGAVSPRSGTDWIFQGNTIRFAKTVGIDVGNETWDGKALKETNEDQKVRTHDGGHAIVEGNTVSDNGLAGIIGWTHNGAVIRNNIVERNNALGFTNSDVKWEEWGGIKLHEGAAVIEGNLIRDNDCYGIWLDNNYTGSHISRNVVLNNRMAGIFLELGDGHALIDNNIIAFTRPRDAFYPGMGIYAHDASGLVIAHNLIVGNADCGILLRTVSDRVFAGVPVHISHTRILNNILWNNSRAAICLPYPGDRASDNLSDYNVVSGSRDVWLGFDPSPTLFAINLNKSQTPIDQVYADLKAALARGNQPAESIPPFATWRRYPTLSLVQWRLLTGQDQHSIEPPDPLTLVLRPEVPVLTLKVKPELLQLDCPPVEGVDHDFFGNPIAGPHIRPGPFQDLDQNGIERILFPVRALHPSS